MTGWWTGSGQSFIEILAGSVEVGLPDIFMRGFGFFLFTFFNILGKFSESSIVPFLVGIVDLPFFVGLFTVEELFIFGFVGFSFNMVGLIVWGKGFTGF